MIDLNLKKPPTEVQAAFIVGYGAGVPKKRLSRKAHAELSRNARIASQILTGGAYNPLEIWDMEKYYKDLVFRLYRKHVRDTRHG